MGVSITRVEDGRRTRSSTRTAPPVNVVTGLNPFGGFLSGASSVQRPNVVSGVPLGIADPNAAGGRRINKAAFATPIGPVQGNLGRNALPRIRRYAGTSTGFRRSFAGRGDVSGFGNKTSARWRLEFE